MSRLELELILVRQEGLWISTIAVVKMWFSSSTAAKEPKLALTKAVSKWVEETQEGAEAWAAAGEDLNIGDLAQYLNPGLLEDSDDSLQWYLAAEGISALEVNIFGAAERDWSFDSVLVNLAG